MEPALQLPVAPPDARQGPGQDRGFGGVGSGVGGPHPQLGEPAGVLVGLVREVVPDDPVAGSGLLRGLGDVGVHAARHEQPLHPVAPAAQGLLRLVLEENPRW